MPRKPSPIDRLQPRVNSIAAEFARAERELAKLVLGALVSGDLGTPRFREQRRQAVVAILERMRKKAVPEAEALVKAAYRSGVDLARQAVKERPTSRLQADAISLLTDNLNSRLGEAALTVGRRVDDVFRREGLRIAAEQMGRERQVEGVAKTMANRLVDQGITSFTDRAGRNWGLETYARMTVRTVTSEAVNTGTVGTLLSRGFDLITIEGPADINDICKKYLGITWSLTGETPGYPRIDRLPPYHGNCRHFVAPAREAVAARRSRRSA